MNARMSCRGGLAAMPNNLPWPEFDCAIVESAAATAFLDLRVAANRAAAEEWPRGRAFGLKSELRWMRPADGLLRLVYIHDNGTLLSGAKEDVPLHYRHEQVIVLWGEREQGGVFSEGRIPIDLQYPAWAPQTKRIAVKTHHYACPIAAPVLRGGHVLMEPQAVYLFRCVELVHA
jgi:hypothetical protein